VAVLLTGTLLGVGATLALMRYRHRPAPPMPPPDPAVAVGVSFNRHANFLERIKREPIDVAWFGDSITDNWRDLPWLFDEFFGSYHAANFGVGWERIENVLWRMQNGELDGYRAKVVILLAGTNNLEAIGFLRPNTPQQTAHGIAALISEIERRQPGAKILLIGILPRGQKSTDPVRPKIQQTNALLAQLDGQRVRYIDIGQRFLEPDGSISATIMPDFIHPSPEGYRRLGDAVRPVLDEMMK
jgi:lysophospholipase L1-like esterase